MKLFNSRLTTLKSKLYAIVFASFVVRVVAFFVLPNTASHLAPDEGTYAELTRWVSKNDLANQHPYYSGLYNSSKALILPASLINRLGLSGLDSVRIVASLLGLLTAVLIVHILLKLCGHYQEVHNFTSNNQRTVILLFSTYAFIPSNLVWSFLGLREAAVGFWVLLAFVVIFLVFEVKKNLSLAAALSLLITLYFVFLSRPQVGWVLGVTLLIYFLIRVKVKAAQLLIPLTLVGVIAGYASTSASSILTTETFVADRQFPVSISTDITPSANAPTKKLTKRPSINEESTLTSAPTSAPTTTPTSAPTTTPTSAPTTTPTSAPTTTPTSAPKTKAESEASLNCEYDGQTVSVGEEMFICAKEIEKTTIIDLRNPGSVVVEQVDAIPQRHEGNKIGAASAIRTLSCPNAGTSRFDNYFCIAYRAPYTTFTFLFRPLLGADVTSNSSLFAAVENIFWLGAFLFVLVMFIQNRRLAFFGALAPSLLFFSIYSVGAGAYEGNMGTAFRHKSLILWVVILLLASTIAATKERKAENKESIS